MSNSTLLYGQLMSYLRQHSRYSDLRHLKALGWMVSALVCSGQLNLAAWEPYVPSRAQKAQSVERRWGRFMGNARIRVEALYLPLVMAALSGWQQSSGLSGAGHDDAMGSLLYDSPVGGLLWTSRALE
jgi:hypothetical protein